MMLSERVSITLFPVSFQVSTVSAMQHDSIELHVANLHAYYFANVSTTEKPHRKNQLLATLYFLPNISQQVSFSYACL